MSRAFIGLSVLLLCVSACLAHHECIHDQLKPDVDFFQMEDEIIMRSRNLGAANWQPIRIHADFSNLRVANPAHADFLKNKLVPAGIKFFSQLLSVQPSDVIKLRSPQCHKTIVPNQYVNPGVSDVDLVIFVTAENDGPSSNAQAWAIHCAQSPLDGRPTAGQINFTPYMISDDSIYWDEQFSVMIHELTHVLGFSQNLYSSWRTPNGANPVGHGTIRQKQAQFIITPRVVNYMKRYFNCPAVTGAELEDNGSSGSAGSHWERRVFGNEAMTASVIHNAKYTALTLALLEDSGWYKPDYGKAEAMVYGRDAGCAFLTEDCIDRNTKKARFPEFCDTPNKETCTFDHVSKGTCLIVGGNTRYDYFGNGLQAIDSFADECPSVKARDQGNCSVRLTSSRYLPESFGSSSRCFCGTILAPGYRMPVEDTGFCGCYNHQCQNQRLYVQVGQNMVPCPIGGGQTAPISGYNNGYLICPHEKYICNANSPINPNFSNA